MSGFIKKKYDNVKSYCRAEFGRKTPSNSLATSMQRAKGARFDGYVGSKFIRKTTRGGKEKSLANKSNVDSAVDVRRLICLVETSVMVRAAGIEPAQG